MRAVLLDRLDGPSALRLAEVPDPVGAHERAGGERLLVDVHAAGLSAIDVLQSYGRYQYGTPAPYVVGSEVAGIVAEAEPGSRFAVGDRVAGIVFWGGVAERAVLAPDYSIRLPDDLPFTDAAATYLDWSTAYYAYERARVTPGQHVLLQGAAGGVGTAVLGLADTVGARVIAVVSSEEKAAAARAAGAWATVRSDGPWLEEVRALTGGRGVDAVLDPVGGDRFTDSVRSLAIGGILVVIGFVGGTIPTVATNRLLLRNLTVTGISMDVMDRERPGTLARVRDAVEALLAEGRIRPRARRVVPLEGTAEALADLEAGRTIGKTVVAVRP